MSRGGLVGCSNTTIQNPSPAPSSTAHNWALVRRQHQSPHNPVVPSITVLTLPVARHRHLPASLLPPAPPTSTAASQALPGSSSPADVGYPHAPAQSPGTRSSPQRLLQLLHPTTRPPQRLHPLHPAHLPNLTRPRQLRPKHRQVHLRYTSYRFFHRGFVYRRSLMRGVVRGGVRMNPRSHLRRAIPPLRYLGDVGISDALSDDVEYGLAFGIGVYDAEETCTVVEQSSCCCYSYPVILASAGEGREGLSSTYGMYRTNQRTTALRRSAWSRAFR